MITYVIIYVLVASAIAIGQSFTRKKTTIGETVAKPAEFKVSFSLTATVDTLVTKIEQALAGSDFEVISKESGKLIITDNKVVHSGTFTVSPGDVIYQVACSPLSADLTEAKLSATERSHFLSAPALTRERFWALVTILSKSLNTSPSQIEDTDKARSVGAKARDLLAVFLIAALVIGGIILAAYLLYGR